MNWKAEATGKLRRYDAMHQAEKNLSEEIDRLQVAENAPEDERLNELVQHGELEDSLRQVRKWLQSVSRALAALTPEEKLVLYRMHMYPEKGNVDRLCEELRLEKSSVYRRRKRALRKFTIALYGAEES